MTNFKCTQIGYLFIDCLFSAAILCHIHVNICLECIMGKIAKVVSSGVFNILVSANTRFEQSKMYDQIQCKVFWLYQQDVDIALTYRQCGLKLP